MYTNPILPFILEDGFSIRRFFESVNTKFPEVTPEWERRFCPADTRFLTAGFFLVMMIADETQLFLHNRSPSVSIKRIIGGFFCSVVIRRGGVAGTGPFRVRAFRIIEGHDSHSRGSLHHGF